MRILGREPHTRRDDGHGRLVLLASDHSLGRWQRNLADLTQRTGVQTMWYEKAAND